MAAAYVVSRSLNWHRSHARRAVPLSQVDQIGSYPEPLSQNCCAARAFVVGDMSPTWPIRVRSGWKLIDPTLAVQTRNAIAELRVLVSQTGDLFA